MRVILHLLTKPDDALACEVVDCQTANGENKIVVMDLTQKNPDYKELLRQVFAADNVESW